MQKFNLSALDSTKMTLANEDILNEVNGGCTFVCTTVDNCVGKYTVWTMVNRCSAFSPCPKGAVKYVRNKNADAQSATQFDVEPIVDIDVVGDQIVVLDTIYSVSWGTGKAVDLTYHNGWHLY